MNQRIVWVQDLDFWKNSGGAQLTDRGMAREGIRRGYDIFPLTPENISAPIDPERDFVVVSNCSRFDPKKLLTLKNRYAVFHHDYWFGCKWRLYFPMTEKCFSPRCPQSPVWKPILERASLHIFLSPLHYHVVKEQFGEAVEPHLLVPSAVDPSLFFDQERPDRAGTCSLNGLVQFKGRANHLKWVNEHPQERITFAGENDRPEEPLPPNCSFEGPIPEIGDNPLCSWYNRFEWYLELPDTPQPFNRVVAESYLSGCKIRGNGLSGALSWPWFTSRKEVAEHVKQAPGDFWAGLEAVM